VTFGLRKSGITITEVGESKTDGANQGKGYHYSLPIDMLVNKHLIIM
jgi:hypothetical protein